MSILSGFRNSIRNRDNIQLILLQIFIAGLFCPIKVSNVTMFALVGYGIFCGNWRNLLKRTEWTLPIVLLVGFYFLHVLGLAFTDNFFSAFRELDKKIPYVLLPVALVGIDSNLLRASRTRLLKFYVICCLATCVFLLVVACFRYFTEHSAEVFYFIEFSKIINNFNPIYLAIYVVFAAVVYFYELQVMAPRHSVARDLVLFFTFLFFLVLISSKISLFVFLLLTIHYVFKRIPDLRRRLVLGTAAIAIIVAFVSISKTTRERIADLFNSDLTGILQDDYTLKASTYSGLTIRISFWKITLKELSRDQLLLTGVGTGDQNDYLNAAYVPYGLIAAGFTNFNLHNSYMEVVLELGLVGLTYFIILWVVIIRRGVKTSDQLLILLAVIFLIFSMTESLWWVNKGIAFFTFWICTLSKSSPVGGMSYDRSRSSL